MALPGKTKEEVIRLLTEGKLSKRAIHRQTGVSRVTIDKIENNLLFPPKRREIPKTLPRSKTIEMIDCPSCGKRMVKDTPCITCSLVKKPPIERDWLDELLSPGK